jgi:hypothetical protein
MSDDERIVMTHNDWENDRGRYVLEDGSPAVLRLDESGETVVVPVALLDFSDYERTGQLPYVTREADVIELRRKPSGTPAR